MNLCCPCDELKHPARLDIPAGLVSLPRQPAGFPEYRLAMLRDIPSHVPLARWRARAGNDLGIMLVEMWAYVLDVLGFYDERIANESYLRTALLRPSLRQLAGLIGYLPRPALAASVELAAIADGVKAVTLPPQTAFRSDAFDGEPPQVFETEVEHTIHPLANQWTLGAVRDRLPGDALLFETGTAAFTRGQLILFRWPSGTTTELRVGRVTAVETVMTLDGANYVSPEITPTPALDPSIELVAVATLSPSASAVSNLLAPNPVSDARGIILDAFYFGLAVQDPVVIQRDNEFHAALITGVFRENVVVAAVTNAHTAAPTIPATRITISPVLPSGWAANPERLVIHFRMIYSGTLTRPAKTHLNTTDFASPGAPIEGIVEPLPGSGSEPSELLLLDAADNGVLAGRVLLAADTEPFESALRTPVTVFGNVVKATRGQSVSNEVLGSGDAAQGFQTLTLANKPLTYFNDASAPNGRRSTLQVRVNGILRKEASSFFGAGPHDEVYIVRQNDAGESAVTFGDGRTGARLPSGIDNVTATYRFGAGAAKPPAGAIGQIARPVKGLRRVVNPVAAGGGADADQPKDMRKNAPTSALILGRAVSLPDFEALAREFGGVVNAHVEWAWDQTTQGAAVKVWFISDGGDIGTELRSFLIGQTDPNTPLVVLEAQAQPSELVIDLEIDARFNGQSVSEQAEQALTNPDTGVLARENIPIGVPLFCSRIFEVVLNVAGVLSVRAITVDGNPAPFAISAAQGRYRDFLGALLIHATPTTAMPPGA
jgi:predicted phage baseplate assembly protein